MITNDEFPLFEDILFDTNSLMDNFSETFEEYFDSSFSTLTLINPPESSYHVRYLSEILLNKLTTKHRNVSPRYLRGCRGRYVTVQLPILPFDSTNLYIRVTRLTLPFDKQSFIHPYPLVYCNPKQKENDDDIIIHGVSIYYRLNKEEICSASKQFPHIILTRLKQCHLKQLTHLESFDQPGYHQAFETPHVKRRIAFYQLKQSLIDFRVVIRREQTEEFIDTGIFCRSNPLLEEEGIEYKRSMRRKCL